MGGFSFNSGWGLCEEEGCATASSEAGGWDARGLPSSSQLAHSPLQRRPTLALLRPNSFAPPKTPQPEVHHMPPASTSLAQPASPYLTESPENRKVVNRLARSVPCIALLFKLQSARKVFTSFLCRFLQLLQALSIYKRRCINLLLL